MKTKFKCCEINETNRELINAFIMKYWYDIKMVIRNEIVDLSSTDGFCIMDKESIVGLITFRTLCNEIEITLLHSIIRNKGIGTLLLEKLIAHSKSQGIKRIVVVTTNDNINAISFYQKKGFDMVRLYRNAMDYTRKIKPAVPLIGENDIPLRHELEFEILL